MPSPGLGPCTMNTPRQCLVWLRVEKPVYQAFRTSIDLLTCCQVMTEYRFFRKLSFRRDNSFFCHPRTGMSALFLAILSQISSTIRILSGRGKVSIFLHDLVIFEISQKKWSESTGFLWFSVLLMDDCSPRSGYHYNIRRNIRWCSASVCRLLLGEDDRAKCGLQCSSLDFFP